MLSELRITTIQTDIVWEAPTKNLLAYNKIIQTISNTHLIILPEMFTTGFSMNAAMLAENTTGATLQHMQSWARQKNCAVTGSIIFCENDLYYNRLFWVNADGSFSYYNKRHLFSLSNEPAVYTSGTEKIIAEIEGWRILPLICYDLRFPLWSRNSITENGPAYDLLLYVANWPEKRNAAWKQLLIARAIENQSYVTGVNRIGNDGSMTNHSGDTAVIDPYGTTIYSCSNMAEVATHVLSRSVLDECHNKLPFLKDADSFTIN